MYNKYAYEKYDENKFSSEITPFCEDYRVFLSKSKTERLATRNAVELAIAHGYKRLDSVASLKPGDKVYDVNRDKNVVLFVIGTEKITNGINILGAHIDSPRIDLKQNPLYESTSFALLDTHYYGGIKKYQWVARPLSLIGVIYKKDGSVVEVNIGDNPNDPVFGISDLLIHLSQEQLTKPAAKVIEGENLDVTFGSLALTEGENKDVKSNVLRILKEKYGVEEDDFVSAEIEVVPQGEAKDYGIDKSMIAGYGHDDRVCAYTSLRAILDVENPKRTSLSLIHI